MILPTQLAAPPPSHSVQRDAPDGSRLFVPRAHLGTDAGVPFPPFCVKCGAPSTAPLERSYYWHEPWVYLFILPGLLIYAILALAVRRRLNVIVPLCAEHRRRRRRTILAAWLVVLGGTAIPIALAAQLGVGAGWTFLLIPVGIIAGGIIGVSANPLTPKRIDDAGGTFNGAGEPFLRKLP